MAKIEQSNCYGVEGFQASVCNHNFLITLYFVLLLQSGLLQQLMSHHEKLQSVMLHISELVQREAFTSALYSLGLLGNSSNHSEECLKCSSSTTTSIKTKQEVCKLLISLYYFILKLYIIFS